MIGRSFRPHSGHLLLFERAVFGALIDSVLQVHRDFFFFFSFGDKNPRDVK